MAAGAPGCQCDQQCCVAGYAGVGPGSGLRHGTVYIDSAECIAYEDRTGDCSADLLPPDWWYDCPCSHGFGNDFRLPARISESAAGSGTPAHSCKCPGGFPQPASTAFAGFAGTDAGPIRCSGPTNAGAVPPGHRSSQNWPGTGYP